MVRYHINPATGNPGICRADPEKPNYRGCLFEASDSEHYPTREAAQLAYEGTMEAKELFGPQGVEVSSLLSRAEELPADRIEQLESAVQEQGIEGTEAWSKAWNYGLKVRTDALDEIYTRGDSLPTGVDITGIALMLRDRIDGQNFTQDDYDVLTGPWRTTVGALHPEDSNRG